MAATDRFEYYKQFYFYNHYVLGQTNAVLKSLQIIDSPSFRASVKRRAIELEELLQQKTAVSCEDLTRLQLREAPFSHAGITEVHTHAWCGAFARAVALAVSWPMMQGGLSHPLGTLEKYWDDSCLGESQKLAERFSAVDFRFIGCSLEIELHAIQAKTETQVSQSRAGDAVPVPPCAPLSARLERLEKRLSRLRGKDGSCCVEVENPVRSKPQYLYYVASVLPILDELAASVERPSKEKID